MSYINTIVVLDTETNGKEPGVALLEIAFVVLALPDSGEEERAWTPAHFYSEFVEFEGQLDPGARAVHHIRPEQVAPGAPGCAPPGTLVARMLRAEVPGEMLYAAHNAPFDRGFLPELTLPWIDTLRCARHIWPDAPGYGNQVLRYWRDAEPEPRMLEQEGMVRTIVKSDHDELHVKTVRGLEPLAAHRALYDTACTAALLQDMLREHSPAELLRLTATPVLLKICPFKKHQGVPWAEVPRDYLSWISRTPDMMKDEDLAHTVRHHLGGG